MTQDLSDSRLDYSDRPINLPDQDLFGIDPFVRALARSVREMRTPEGVVIALNGPWGSGKSSAINLMRHHLQEAVERSQLELVSFNPWWFRGEEALVLAFFRELYAATKPSLTEKGLKALPKLGARLLKAGGVVAPAADAMGASGAGAIAAGTMKWLSSLIEDDDSVEKLHEELAAALASQIKRFIVLIDDIDRLAPDEALAVFRLVKSVGRLPNVIYLLAFDRTLAERMVSERFPSEGPHYLEKIVQASFELPVPVEADLHRHLQTRLFEISGVPGEKTIVHVMNMFYAVVGVEIKTPRDAVRFVNAFSITWPAVAGNVDLGDFLALEAYRLFRPGVYQALRANRSLVCGSSELGMGRSKVSSDELDARLLPGVTDPSRLRPGLMRLFPKLESLWSNVFHSADARWARQRRACDSAHFPTYFQLSTPDDVVPRAELDRLLAHAGDADYVANSLRAAVHVQRRDGGTRAAIILDALTIHAPDVPLELAETLLTGVFASADDLDVDADHAKAFSIGNNNLRVHWLLRALLLERTDLATRSTTLMRAARDAPPGWLVDLAASAWEDHHPREGTEPEVEAKCLTTEPDARQLVAASLRAITDAAHDRSLIEHRRLAYLLYRWRDLAADGGAAVRCWTGARLDEDASVVRFASAFTSHSWGQGMSFNGMDDFVARRSDRAQVDHLDEILDLPRFRARVEALATLGADSEEGVIVRRFFTAWERHDRHPD